MAFLPQSELLAFGFASVGRNVRLSEKASIYGPANIVIGDDVRLDDFCVISAGEKGISIGSHVHIAAFCSLIGSERIVLEDFSGLSSRVAVYSSSDDYSGVSMTNPTIPNRYRRVTSGVVRIGKHVIVGAGSIVLPGVSLGAGCAVGAMSLVDESHPEFSVIAGIPAKQIGYRSRDLLELEAQFRLSSSSKIPR